MPTYGLHVPDDWEHKKVFDEALAPYKGKPSPFIRYAVEQALIHKKDTPRRVYPVGAFYGAGLAASKAARNSSSVGSVAGGSASSP